MKKRLLEKITGTDETIKITGSKPLVNIDNCIMEMFLSYCTLNKDNI